MNPFAIVTGGSKGIGKAVIKALAASGFDVLTCARKFADLELLKADIEREFGTTLFIEKADLSIRSDIEDFYSAFESLHRPLDVLVHNAGTFAPGSILEEEIGVFEQLMDTNIASAYHLSRRFIPHMVRRKSGHVFTICSTASIMGYPNGGSYCISKHALLGLSRVLREELKPHNIRVTAILPGATYTQSWEASGLPEERFMKAEDVAEALISAYALSPGAVAEEILLRPMQGDI